MKYTVKDSVFTDIFKEKKYLLQLYQALHPEDDETTEDDLKDVTISNVLVDDIYNDIGFTVGSTLLILIESQSTWTVNIIFRAMMYLMQTYREYFKNTKQNLYRSKKSGHQSQRFMLSTQGTGRQGQRKFPCPRNFSAGKIYALMRR